MGLVESTTNAANRLQCTRCAQVKSQFTTGICLRGLRAMGAVFITLQNADPFVTQIQSQPGLAIPEAPIDTISLNHFFIANDELKGSAGVGLQALLGGPVANDASREPARNVKRKSETDVVLTLVNAV